MSGSLTRGGENCHGIPDASAARNFAYLVRSPLEQKAEAKYSYASVVVKVPIILTYILFPNWYLADIIDKFIYKISITANVKHTTYAKKLLSFIV